VKHIGENRVQEALSAIGFEGRKLTWHFIGAFKPTKREGENFDWVRSVDRLDAAKPWRVACRIAPASRAY
jgi:uncharacterized pyridoxal phosphate-containing UPF0001 family protein